MNSYARRAATGVAAAAVLTLGLLAPVNPAAAATTGVVDHSKYTNGTAVKLSHPDFGDTNPTTGLIALKLDDDTALKTYCIELGVTAKDGATMVEDKWKNYPRDGQFKDKVKPAKVNWILQNSYPNIKDLSALASKAGIDSLSKKDAIGGTQAAIWHFSNGADLRNGNDDEVAALYKYLTGKANTGITDEPTASLEITPPSETGMAGEKIGPYTIATTADSAALSLKDAPEGVTLVDAEGNDVTEAKDGDEVYVMTPEGPAGTATIKATAEAEVLTGRLFRGDGKYDGKGKHQETQTLIVASSEDTTVKDKAAAKWTETVKESPTPTTAAPSESAPGKGGDLPVTGSAVTGLAVGGAALLAVGGVAVFFARRRHNA